MDGNDGMRQRLRQGCGEDDHGCNPREQSFDVLPLFRNERDPGTRKPQRAFDGQTAVSQPPSLPPDESWVLAIYR
jgi:hypothetical protein